MTLNGAPVASEPSRFDRLNEIADRLQPRYDTITETVTATLREAILKGVFEPGEHLRQYEIAEWLGVSPLPVRSAVAQLESEGLVEFHPHRGIVVAELDSDKVRQLFDIRCQLDILAIEKAIHTMTPEKLARLEELEARLDLESEGYALIDLREEFYHALYDRDSSPRLIDLIERLRIATARYLPRFGLSDPGNWQHHADLIELLRAGDVPGAQAYIRRHLTNVRDRLIAHIDQASAQQHQSTERRHRRLASAPVRRGRTA
jgi:DNA-binding GntR family transcriptional regulator